MLANGIITLVWAAVSKLEEKERVYLDRNLKYYDVRFPFLDFDAFTPGTK